MSKAKQIVSSQYFLFGRVGSEVLDRKFLLMRDEAERIQQLVKDGLSTVEKEFERFTGYCDNQVKLVIEYS